MTSTGIDGKNRRGKSGIQVGAGGPPVAGYFAWYDATQITGHADGATVSPWRDLSANGYDMTEATHPPVYHNTGATLINGLPVVKFDGATTLLTATGMPAENQPYTVFFVFKAVNWNQVGAQNPFLLSSGGGFVVFGVQTSAAGAWEIYAGTTIQTGGTSDLNAHSATIVYNGASSLLKIDSSTVITGLNPGTHALVSAQTSLGNLAGSGSGNFNGSMGEVIFYGSALSAGDQTSVYTYLKGKWGTP